MSRACPNCGLANEDDSAFCRGCGKDLGPPPIPGLPPPPPFAEPIRGGSVGHGVDFDNLPPSISTNILWAILSTILCCLPLGIVSVVYAARVNTLLFRGDIPAAQRASRLARNWAIASVAVFVAWWILYGVVVAIWGVGAWRRLHTWSTW